MFTLLFPTSIGLMLMGAISMIWLKLRDVKQAQKRQQQGILRLEKMRLLISRIQKHRGLSTGYLNGDKNSLPDIKQLQYSIAGDIISIKKLDIGLNQDERWPNVLSHWKRLSEKFNHREVDNNFNQHTQLIRSLLYLIEDIADGHQLLKLKHPHIQSSRVLWKELLIAIECIGQARAIGTGVAAAGECDSIARIRLNYLKQRIAETSTKVWQGLPAAKGDEEQLNQLVKEIELKLLTGKPSITASEYFKRCSQMIDALYDYFDKYMEELKEVAS
jgi:hypothetical protein